MRFQLKNPSDKAWSFSLLSNEGNILLNSSTFTTREEAVDYIRQSIIALRTDQRIKISGNTFELTDADGYAIGTSINYNSRDAAKTASETLQIQASGTEDFAVEFTTTTTTTKATTKLSKTLPKPPSRAEMTKLYNISRKTISGNMGFDLFEEEGRYWYLFNSSNGYPMLYSKGFDTSSKRKTNIRSTLRYAGKDKYYEKVEENGQHYFIIKTPNGFECARSARYATASDRDTAITYFIANSPDYKKEYAKPTKKAREAAQEYVFDKPSTSNDKGFETFRNDEIKKHYFHFNGADGKAILYSQGYRGGKARDNGVRSVIKNSVNRDRFKIKEKNGQWYFVLLAANNTEIARSAMLSSNAIAEKHIAYILGNARTYAAAFEVDLTPKTKTTSSTETFNLNVDIPEEPKVDEAALALAAAAALAEENAKKEAERNRLAAEAEAKRKAEAERNRLAAEAQAKRKAEAERNRLAAEAEAKRKAEAERNRLAAEAEAKRKAEAERNRLAAEAEAKRKAEAERNRLAAEAEAKRKAEAERNRLAAEAEAKRKAEAERNRLAAEAEAKRKAEAERNRLAAEAEAKRKAEAERNRLAAEAEAKRAEEKKIAMAAAAALAIKEAEEKKLRLEAERKAAIEKRAQELETKRKADEAKRALELEAKRKADEARRAVELEAKRKADALAAEQKAKEEKIALAAAAAAAATALAAKKADEAKRKAEAAREAEALEQKRKAEEVRRKAQAESDRLAAQAKRESEAKLLAAKKAKDAQRAERTRIAAEEEKAKKAKAHAERLAAQAARKKEKAAASVAAMSTASTPPPSNTEEYGEGSWFGKNWWWLLGLLLGLLALMYFLRSCDGCAADKTSVVTKKTEVTPVVKEDVKDVVEIPVKEEPKIARGKTGAQLGFTRGTLAYRMADCLADPDCTLPGSYTMDAVQFTTGEAHMNKGAYPTVEDLAKLMKAYPNMNLSIVGHIDGTEKDAYNGAYQDGSGITLSEIRSRCLYKKLQKRGISKSRLSFSGKGKTQNIGNNTTNSGRQENRRLELIMDLK